MGEFSDRRWQAAVKKLLAREYAVASITAQTPASPNEQIWLTTHVNPPGTDDGRVSGTVQVMASLSYLRRLIAFPDRVEALLQLGIAAWNGIDGGPAYGYATLAISPPRAMFPQWSAQGPGAPLRAASLGCAPRWRGCASNRSGMAACSWWRRTVHSLTTRRTAATVFCGCTQRCSRRSCRARRRRTTSARCSGLFYRERREVMP